MNPNLIVPKVYPKPGDSVHLMLTCLCDAFYPAAGIAAVNCLEATGYKVIFDERQTCCGQPAFNAGDWESARSVARHWMEVFADAEAVVAPSGSCTAMIRWGFPQFFEGQPDYSKIVAFAEKTWEIAEFLDQAAKAAPWKGRYQGKVALHRSCHLRELSTGDAPERLLQGVAGIEISPLRAPEQCCGFGGTFAVTFPWTSHEIGEDKLQAIRDTGAEELVSTDMGCLMHLSGLQQKDEREGQAPPLRLRHLVELLDEARRNLEETEAAAS